MSVWSTKATGRARNFIVIQHRLRGVNYTINGVRFRDGYAVVEKDSKTYRSLKQMPILNNAKEYALLHLKDLPFITRSIDVKNVFGQEVYSHYLKELDSFIKEQEIQKVETEQIIEVQQHKLENKCQHTLANGNLCGHVAVDMELSNHCQFHLLEDPKLEQLGIQIPRFMTSKEKKKMKEKVLDTLRKMKKEGKF